MITTSSKTHKHVIGGLPIGRRGTKRSLANKAVKTIPKFRDNLCRSTLSLKYLA